ncbi:MAG: response regulator transcription factor, partial [Acidimicrobiales bacterium]
MRVLIVDDHKLLADALKAVLETHGDIDVVGSAGSGATARELAASLRPDVILMDQCLPDASGLE